MMDAFRWLGPIEALDWLAVYFEKASAAGRRPKFARMLADAHRGRRAEALSAPWLDELVVDVRILVAKYKPKEQAHRRKMSAS